MDVKYVIAGRLRRDTLLPASGKALIDVPGGSLLQTAVGLSVWDGGCGLLARAGEDEDAGVRSAVAASRVRLRLASGGRTGLSEGAEAGRNFT
jgi:hypothetical protein